ncbi:filamentous hemagglutinin N-terminal domain-containing protein [Beggiatoa leptomitoformis]|uniref:Filamentous hemagglutinin N-terminal domain-containing protein n=1 Tax=Beggiatoa leptomitoformis TaxID=288004 RepID=A0A2N9YA72_9GAMM|nr:filamentous hemagglutinin N-terminal domain-containing protein [Beggiatoa leptomitoformis]ALG67233.1 filamentous hemagglutinin N-terminal domain-containing protein [Beggiatoa leptomitoformis]AUI67350.1 filamentous hemagglutinin N-terminal domain-containing protein [Beggiatoa leptomitoformis]
MKSIILSSLFTCLPCFAWADVVLDGSLGKQTALSAPDYQIEASLGQQQGNNLFHSFSEFSLKQGESATFTGVDTLERVISRVTGNQVSVLDGTLRSTIPHADFYFINPNGVIVGQHAEIDVRGGFYLSTADSLIFQDGKEFNAHQTSALLSSAPIHAFGFLHENPAAISLNNSHLSVDEGQSFALIGGEIHIQGENFYLSPEEEGFIPAVDAAAVISAKNGRIDLVGLKSAATVELNAQGIITKNNSLFNTVHLQNTYLDVSGDGGGSIFIRAGDFILQRSHLRSYSQDQAGGLIYIKAENIAFQDGSELFTHTFGRGDATDIILEAQENIWLHGNNSAGEEQRASSIAAYTYSKDPNGGQSSDVTLKANNIFFEEGGHFIGSVEGTGSGGFVTFHAGETILFQGESPTHWRAGITVDNVSRTATSGNANSVLLEAKNIFIEAGAGIEGGTRGQGDLGDYTIKASDTLVLRGVQASNGTGSRILARVLGGSLGGGGGEILIEAGELQLNDGALILATTTGKGNGGNITINVQNTLQLQGTSANGSSSGIIANSEGARTILNVGEGGKITITAGTLQMQDGAKISSNSLASTNSIANHAGEIHITVAGDMILSGVNPYGETDEGLGTGIYARSNASQVETGQAGNAGKINIKSQRLVLENGAILSSSTNNSRQGGDIDVTATEIIIRGDSQHIALLPANKAQKSFEEDMNKSAASISQSGIYARTESPYSNGGDGGTIRLYADSFTLTDNANISTASAGSGHAGSIYLFTQRANLQTQGKISTEAVNAGGGEITLKIGTLLHLQDCKITTSVQDGAGNGGNVTVDSPIFIVLENSDIIAQASGGNGGNIYLNTKEFIASNSIVDASSDLGIDGDIIITSPIADLNGSLIVLPSGFASVSEMIQNGCKIDDVKELSRFHHKTQRDGVPKTPEHWLE